jgi:intracellular septation protein A
MNWSPVPGSEPGGSPSVASGLAQAMAEQFSFESAVGGVRGLLESVVPTLVFTAVYTLGNDLQRSLIAAVGTAVLLTVVRLVQRQTVMQAVSGLMGVALAAAIAWYTHSAINFFLASILKNAFFTVLCLISIVVRWPYVGVLLGLMLGEGTHWRQVPARARAYTWATWAWVAMFVIRLGFQVPLYLRDHVTGLGAASVPLGLPLVGLTVLVCWLIVRRVPLARPAAEAPDDAPPDDAPEPPR